MKRLIIFLVAAVLYVGLITTLYVSVNKTVATQSLPQVAESVIDSVVHISNDTQRCQGSGVIISDNLVITARHVVKNGERFTVTFNCGKAVTVTRAISSEKYDIGFIWVDESMSTPARLGDMKDLRLGQSVFAIGSPYGKMNFNSLTSGIVSGLNRDWEIKNVHTGEKYGWEIMFTSDSAGHSGNSGCPIFTMDGVVRGILVGGYSPVLNGVVPVDLVLSDIEEIEQMFVEAEYYIEEVPVLELFYEGYY